MKSQVICDALNAVNPTPAQRARMRAALEAQLPAEKPHRRGAHQQKASSQRWWTIIPAAAALFAVVLLGIFVLGRTDKTPPSMSNVPTEPLTLESLQSSANYKASMEIKDYVQSYNATGDVDETLSEAYRAYGCRNTKMAQKVDEICTKYGLNKVGDGISPDTTEEMFTALNVRSMVKVSGNGDVTTSNPSYSADGNFEFWGATTVSGVDYPIEYRVYRAMKQSLSTAYWEIENTSDYQWSNYVTTAGTDVLIAVGQNNSLVLTDTGDSVVVIVVMNATTGDTQTGKAALEAFANTFDLSLAPRTRNAPVETTAPTESGTAIPEAYQPVIAKYVTALTEHWGGEACSNADISLLVSYATSPSELGYALLDLDNDGTDELIIANDAERQVIYDLYSLVDGKLVHVFTGWDRNSYELREGYRILNIGSNGAASADYVYCHLSNGQLVTDSLIRFDAATDPDHPWFRGTGENDLAPITDENWSEDEIYSTAASLPIAITSFADDSVGSYDPALADYEGYLSTIDTSSIKYYALRDLDGDGQDELLLYNSGETLMKVAAIQNGTAQEILSGNVLDICEGNVLEAWEGGSGAEQRTYYRVENHTAVPFECIIYNIDENQCYRDSNYDFYEENLTPITEEEYNRVVNTYPGMSFWDCNPKPLEKMNSADSSAAEDAQLLANYGGYLSSIDTYWIKYYALRDLDGDGQDELLLFNRDKTLSNVAGVLNGTAREILSGSSLYLCAGNVLEYWGEGSGGSGCTYYQVENKTAVPIESITYRGNNDQWYRDGDFDFMKEDLTPITNEEYQRIVDTYPRMTMSDCNARALPEI
ncbi:MAG: hypothetical protein UF383_03985 [Oscillospiraceae bacterium]|nr:hypothetical protein [Oscillospiraceae bacterium]